MEEAENLAVEVETDAKNDAAVIPITQDTLSSTVGYEDGHTDDLWILVVYEDKKADKDAAVLQAIHNAAEDVSEEGFKLFFYII